MITETREEQNLNPLRPQSQSARELAVIAKKIRLDTFEMVVQAKRGHLGGSFSSTDLLVALYYGKILRFDAENPQWHGRDRFVMSKGHANNSLYVILANLGFFSKDHLLNYCGDDGLLGGHVEKHVPGNEITSGSLGHGLGLASGMALAAKIDGKTHLVVTMIGDGESQEGSIWEAAMFASQHKLHNLIGITDRNMLGSEDFTENTCGLNPLKDKWEAFGWEVRSIDGHDFSEILSAFADVRDRNSEKPLMIIAHTVKGKGLPTLENTPKAHHTLPDALGIARTREELQ